MLAMERMPLSFDENALDALPGGDTPTAAADRVESSTGDETDEPLERASAFLTRAERAFASMQLDLAAHADERASLRRLVAAMSTALLDSLTTQFTPNVTTRANASATDASQTAGASLSQNAQLRKRIDELDELVASLLHQVELSLELCSRYISVSTCLAISLRISTRCPDIPVVRSLLDRSRGGANQRAFGPRRDAATAGCGAHRQ
jgi:hypothetical protein